MITDVEREFELLVEKAEKCILEYPTAEQVIVVKTAKSNVRFFANNVLGEKYEEEKMFIQKLIEEDDIIILSMVCMWNDSSVDFPSMNFRKLLLKISEQNKYTKMYLSNGVREIQQSMP